jgi:hypothetical protein
MTKRTTYLASIALLTLGAISASSAQAKFVAVFEETEALGSPAVQEIGDGTIDLADLGAGSSTTVNRASISPSNATTALGANRSNMTFFFNAVISGPNRFGAGPGAFANRISGNAVVVSPSFIGVPEGYVSGAPLRNTTSWINATYDSLGMTPGVYIWNWGSGADADSITFDIVAPIFAADGAPIANNSILSELPLPTEFTFPLTVAAPEPSTWAMMLIGFAGIGYAAMRRKDGVRAISA